MPIPQIRPPRIPVDDIRKESHFAPFIAKPTNTLQDWLSGIKRAHIYTRPYRNARDKALIMSQRSLDVEEGGILIISGPSQGGKTHIIDRLVTLGRWQEQPANAEAPIGGRRQKQLADAEVPTDKTKKQFPVIYIRQPSINRTSPAKALAETLLTHLNCHEELRGNSESFIVDKLLPAKLDEHGVKVVVMDEIHKAISELNDHNVRRTADALRMYATRMGKGRVNIILAGLQKPLDRLLDANVETFLRTVKIKVLVFRPSKIDTYTEMLQELEYQMGLDQGVLSDPDMVKRLMMASDGLLGLTIRLIQSAAEQAVLDDRELNPSKDLIASYTELFPNSGSESCPNPFKLLRSDLDGRLTDHFDTLDKKAIEAATTASATTGLVGTAKKNGSRPARPPA